MFSRFFIERPIFAIVVALLIVLAGLVSMGGAAGYGDAKWSRRVRDHGLGDLPGGRLEDARRLGRLADRGPDQRRRRHALHEQREFGATSALTVYFALDTDPDIAQVQVQNRVNLALPQLHLRRSRSRACRCRRSRRRS